MLRYLNSCRLSNPNQSEKKDRMLRVSSKIWGATLAFTTVAITIFYFHKWVISLTDHKLKGKILRAEIVVIIQSGLACVSYFVWRNIASIFSAGKSRTKSAQARNKTGSKNGKDLDEIKPSNINGTSAGSKFWKLLVFFYLCLAHGSYISNVFLIRTNPQMYSVLSYFMLGFHVQMATGLVLVTVLNFFMKIVSQQTLKHRVAVFMAIVYALSMSMYGFYNTRKPPTIKHVTIPVTDLPVTLNGLTITHIPDIHLGPVTGQKEMLRIVQMVNDIHSDVVVIVGDLVDGGLEDLRQAAAPIKNIKSKFGTYFVTGNHEYYTMDVEAWFDYLASIGVYILHNTNIPLPRDAPPSQQICLVGTDDLEASRIGYKNHGFHLDRAMKGCDKNLPVILLAHQPKAAKQALDSSYRVDLVLSGHTHGGQMFPLIIGAYLVNPYYVGLYPHGHDSHIYVSQGTNFWGIPMRTFTSKEIAVITLKRKT